MDPGEPDVAQRALDVISDVVRRYDIDAVHLDDYFYPYPITAEPAGSDVQPSDIDFPDEVSWQKYLKSGGKSLRVDWRRDNINRLVRDTYIAVHVIKPWGKFGISPFGLG